MIPGSRDHDHGCPLLRWRKKEAEWPTGEAHGVVWRLYSQVCRNLGCFFSRYIFSRAGKPSMSNWNKHCKEDWSDTVLIHQIWEDYPHRPSLLCGYLRSGNAFVGWDKTKVAPWLPPWASKMPMKHGVFLSQIDGVIAGKSIELTRGTSSKLCLMIHEIHVRSFSRTRSKNSYFSPPALSNSVPKGPWAEKKKRSTLIHPHVLGNHEKVPHLGSFR